MVADGDIVGGRYTSHRGLAANRLSPVKIGNDGTILLNEVDELGGAQRAWMFKDGVLTVNGARVVFRGVNRHEHHPRSGRAVPRSAAPLA